MDLLTRKKLLMRKYNNLTFTAEQLDFFGKINATEILILLRQNAILRSSAIFFQHTSIREIQKVIASVFQPDDAFAKSQLFNIVVNILRGNTMLLQICFKNEDFNYMSIFGFLQQDHIDYSILILLEDVLLPYIRKNPFQIMDVIVNDNAVEQIFLRRVYEKPIFKIMYTVVFCLSKRHSDIYKNDIRKVIHELVNTPFTYLLHKQKKSHRKISIIPLNKTQPKQIKKSQMLIGSREFPSVHMKHVRQKKTKPSSISSLNDLNSIDEPKLTKNVSIGSTLKRSEHSQSQQQQFSNKSQKNLHQHLFPNRGINIHIHSSTEIQNQSMKLIPLNEDLDYGDLTQNMRDLFNDISSNIKYVYLKNVVSLLENFNEAYIDSLIAYCKRFIVNDEYQSYCQGAIYILFEFGELYKAVIKHSLTIPNNNRSDDTVSPPLTEYETELRNLIVKLQKEIKIISSKLPILCSCLLQNNEVSTSYSSGQRVKRVGMTKFKILQLIHQLLSFNSKNNSDSYLNLNNLIDFQLIDLFEIIEKYLTIIKWNNITHAMLVKIAKLALQQDYQGFKQRCLQKIFPKDKILGTLIELFRNKKFVYLANLKFTNYGNFSVIYQITKLIITEIINHNDYEILIEKFPAFDTFLNVDISSFEKCLQGSEMFDPKILEIQGQMINCSVPCEDMNGKIISASLQNAGQLINELQNSKKWIASAFNLIRKESI